MVSSTKKKMFDTQARGLDCLSATKDSNLLKTFIITSFLTRAMHVEHAILLDYALQIWRLLCLA